jgi:hypothetical protein
MIPEALFESLKGLAGNRCYPVKLPERAEFPAITYFEVSGRENNTHDGYDKTSVNRWQVSCWAKTYKEAKELADSVKQQLRAFSGSLIHVVRKSILENEMDLYESDTGIYHIPVEFIFLIREV